MRRGALLLAASMVVSFLVMAVPASAATTSAFNASFKETFGRAHSKQPCEHFLCGKGTVAGFGAATSAFDITDFAPIGDTNCADLGAVMTITLVSDGSTLELDEVGTVCFPGKSSLAPGAQKSFGNPGVIEMTFSVSGGSGVFEGATGSGTASDMPAGDSGHAHLSGTLTLP
jgi:hypothetical protein